MSTKEKKELTARDLEAQQAMVLPDREEMSIINPNTALPWPPSTSPPGIADSPTPGLAPPPPPALS
ncbi:MAG: hypothetical protein M3Y58_09580 [Chloroflexota bacterium]|nr:hypothetical protein [Chloroflexota bacterium]